MIGAAFAVVILYCLFRFANVAYAGLELAVKLAAPLVGAAMFLYMVLMVLGRL